MPAIIPTSSDTDNQLHMNEWMNEWIIFIVKVQVQVQVNQNLGELPPGA